MVTAETTTCLACGYPHAFDTPDKCAVCGDWDGNHDSYQRSVCRSYAMCHIRHLRVERDNEKAESFRLNAELAEAKIKDAEELAALRAEVERLTDTEKMWRSMILGDDADMDTLARHARIGAAVERLVAEGTVRILPPADKEDRFDIYGDNLRGGHGDTLDAALEAAVAQIGEEG